MNEKQEIVLVGMIIAITFMLVLPPYQHVRPEGLVLNAGYSWVFDPPTNGGWGAMVDIPMLLTQWLGVLIVGALAYVLAGRLPQASAGLSVTAGGKEHANSSPLASWQVILCLAILVLAVGSYWYYATRMPPTTSQGAATAPSGVQPNPDYSSASIRDPNTAHPSGAAISVPDASEAQVSAAEPVSTTEDPCPKGLLPAALLSCIREAMADGQIKSISGNVSAREGKAGEFDPGFEQLTQLSPSEVREINSNYSGAWDGEGMRLYLRPTNSGRTYKAIELALSNDCDEAGSFKRDATLSYFVIVPNAEARMDLPTSITIAPLQTNASCGSIVGVWVPFGLSR